MQQRDSTTTPEPTPTPPDVSSQKGNATTSESFWHGFVVGKKQMLEQIISGVTEEHHRRCCGCEACEVKRLVMVKFVGEVKDLLGDDQHRLAEALEVMARVAPLDW